MTNSPNSKDGRFGDNADGSMRDSSGEGLHSRSRLEALSSIPDPLESSDDSTFESQGQRSSGSLEDDALEPQQNAPEVIRVRKKRRHHMSHGKKTALTVVLCVLGALLIAGGAFAFSAYRASKSALDYSDVSVTTPTKTEAVAYSNGKTVEYNGHTYQLNENIVSMVFMGVDKSTLDEEGRSTGQADAVLVVSLDTSTGAVSVISIPRDSMVEVDTYDANGTSTGIRTMQISLAFDYGDGAGTSADNVRKAASRTLYNIPITYYFALEESGIGAMCDSIGGVTLTALNTIPDTNIVEGEDVILTGSDALSYIQYRDITDLNSPLARQERQKQFIKAFAKQVLAQTHGSVNNLVDLYNTALGYSATNLTASDFSYLALSVVNNGVSDISVTSLSGEMVQGETYAEYHLDDAATYETVLNTYYTLVS